MAKMGGIFGLFAALVIAGVGGAVVGSSDAAAEQAEAPPAEIGVVDCGRSSRKCSGDGVAQVTTFWWNGRFCDSTAIAVSDSACSECRAVRVAAGGRQCWVALCGAAATTLFCEAPPTLPEFGP